MSDSLTITIDYDALAERIASRLPASGQRGALTIQGAADYLSLSRSSIYAMIASGEITAVRSGRAIRVPVVELERWIDEQLTEERGTCRNGETVPPIPARTVGTARRSSSKRAKSR